MPLILVVEDEPALLEAYGDILESLGHRTRRVADGTAALTAARQEVPDVIVTDYMMPGRNGIDLIRALRVDDALKHVPVILVSAASPPGADEAWRFLQKPTSVEELERAVADALELRVPDGAAAARPTNVSPLAIAREELLGWVAHEIRTPLSAAVMAADLLRRELEAAKHGGTRRIENVLRQLRRVDQLVKSILDAAAIEHGRLELRAEPFELGELVRETVAFWQVSAPDAQIEVCPHDARAWVAADRERTRQILDNLLSNGLKHGHSDRGLRVEIAVEESVLVRVIDHGQGIAADDLPRVFDRFYRADGAGRGHGLGLYIAAALARVQGGSLRAESERGLGATFVLALPHHHE